MTAPLFLVGGPALDAARPAATIVLDGPEGRHAATVRRIRPGERVDLADGAGRVARCTVTAADRDVLVLEVADLLTVPEPAPRLVLVQALAKGGRDELAVETATEVGVDAVIAWQAARSVVVWRGDRGRRSLERWEATTREAAKQSRRPRVPSVTGPVDLDGLVREVRAAGTALVLEPAAGESLTAVPMPAAGDLLVVVGPEGGLDPGELEALRAAGARAVRLGPEVLRSSTAGAAALVALSVRLRRW